MNENAYRARAERGEIQIGTWVTMIRTPAVLTLLKAAGLDFARIDMEHSPFSIETVADMAALARAMDFPMVVRPPEGNREWITRLLDAGVWNLHVPQVDTPEQAAEVAAGCRHTARCSTTPRAAGHGRAQKRQGGGDADRQRGRCEADDQPRSHDHQLLLGRGGASGGLRLGRRGDSPGVAGALLSRSGA